LFKVRRDEVSFEAIDTWGVRAPPRRWARKRIVIFRVVTDVDPPGSVRPRSRFVMVLRDPPEEVTLVARGKTRQLVASAQSLNEALKLVPRSPEPADATSSHVWLSPGVLRRQSAERWLADAPAPPPENSLPSDPQHPGGGGGGGGPPVLSYMPDPKDQVIEQRWPGRLRLFVPGQTARQLVRDPAGIVMLTMAAMLVIWFLPAAIRAPWLTLPRVPSPLPIVIAIVLATAAVSRLTSTVIEVDADELLLSWRIGMGIGGKRRIRADEITHVAVREHRRVVIYRRAEPKRPISLGWFPTVEDAKSAARDLRAALGLKTVGGPPDSE
jgi:hypothetical protein